MILTSDDQVHPDTHAMTMVNNVIGVVNYVIAARPSLLNFMIADSKGAAGAQDLLGAGEGLLVHGGWPAAARPRRCTTVKPGQTARVNLQCLWHGYLPYSLWHSV